MTHGNAPLTAERSTAALPPDRSRASRSPMWPRPWASRGTALISGGTATTNLGPTVSATVRADRSARRSRTSVEVEERICRHRAGTRSWSDRLGGRLGMSSSTVYRVLVRHDLNRLSHLDRQSGREIRRYERKRPGELVHVDVKKLGKIPGGGGHRVHGTRA